MITKNHLESINLRTRPLGQIFIANTIIRLDYQFPRKTEIVVENQERIPKKPVIFAMNHPDRYNYAPFMYYLLRAGGYPFISPLVKGKYYEHFIGRFFFDLTNNIPLPSRGYLITKDFQAAMKRLPRKAEYRLLRDLVDGKLTPEQLPAEGQLVKEFVTTPRQDFDPQTQSYAQFIEDHFNILMGLVTRICLDALHHKNLSLMIFPQGTRSIRLLPGLTGLAQIGLKAKATIVPVGVNGSEKCYPSSVPFSSGGTVVYRVGQPLDLAADPAWAITEDFEPFTRPAEEKFGARFRELTDLITHHINDLLDPPYQLSAEAPSPSETGVKRFI